MFDYAKEYSKVRGFNIHGDWCRNGIEEWLCFDRAHYQELIHIGKEKFPAMNTVRIWLSFDAYMMDKKKYLNSIKEAGKILTDAGLAVIPTYFNGWFGVPAFGGFTSECLAPDMLPVYENAMRDMIRAMSDTNVLMHDIANEPFNNVNRKKEAFERVMFFLERMTEVARKEDGRKITIGTQSSPKPQNREMCDVDRLAPLVDVISLHPYNVHNLPKEEFKRKFTELIAYIEDFRKPYLITECCWATPTAETRLPYLESELETYHELNTGYIVQGLFTTPVADLHPVEDIGRTEGLYMAFLNKNFEIRKHHDIFNRLTQEIRTRNKD